jgi:hypothetical protein
MGKQKTQPTQTEKESAQAEEPSAKCYGEAEREEFVGTTYSTVNAALLIFS